MSEIKVGRVSFNSEALEGKRLEDATKEFPNIPRSVLVKALKQTKTKPKKQAEK